MFQISILVPFLPGMVSKWWRSCSWEENREYSRMAFRLASESSVTTRDCGPVLRKTGRTLVHKNTTHNTTRLTVYAVKSNRMHGCDSFPKQYPLLQKRRAQNGGTL